MPTAPDSSIEAEISRRVAAAFARVMPRAAYRDDLRQVDCEQWTSLRHVQLMVQLEREFDLRFDGAVVSRLTSIPKVVGELSARLAVVEDLDDQR